METGSRKDAQEAGPTPEPRGAHVLLRRRRADWSTDPRHARDDRRGHGEGEPLATNGSGPGVSQAAVRVAAATLAAYDGQTGGHSDDVVTLCEALAERFGFSAERRTNLLAAAQLHDIGKVAVPSAILGKPAPLDPDEWDTVREHTLRGEHILSAAPELRHVGRIVRHSHERWDGRGYPDGLKGEEIPLESRIVFCADAFHAIRCDRPYRAGRSAGEALEEVRRGSGTQFDPAVVRALTDAAQELRESHTSRLEALTSSVSSRRLLVLLLTLVIGGSAVAAPGSPLAGLFGEGNGDAEALTCDGPCPPADLGPVARLPGAASSPDGVRGAHELGRERGAGLREAGEARGRGPTREDRRGSEAGSSRGEPNAEPRSGPRGGGGGSAPTARAPSGSAGDGNAHGKAIAKGPALERPVPPGRSGEAPGPPSATGPFGPGGRSGEAPGKPADPGSPGNNQGRND